jgi:ribosomal protein S18 acetylase RimI-like enzyme
MEVLRRYDTAFGSVTLRPERGEDEAFLYSLFDAHTGRVLRQGGLPEPAIRTMLEFQFRSNNQTHRRMFPGAIYSIIESGGAAIGRYIEQDEGATVYFVDFALLDDRQAKGLGTALTEKIADEWALKGRAARVEVFHDNTPSLKLCRKIGFVEAGNNGMGYVNLVRPREIALRAKG